MDYTIPFALVASVIPTDGADVGAPRAAVTLHAGQELQLERAGDLGPGNGGMLVFVDDREGPAVPWAEIARIDFDRR